jgi:acetyltransferase EpsM
MKIIGDGGHAAVVREIHSLRPVQYSDSWAFIAVGDNVSRKREAESLQGYLFTSLAHPTAWISPSASIGAGTIVMAGVVVQAHARIGKHVILNTHCSVDHDCVISDYAHIAPGAHLCGNVEIGEGALVGVGVGIEPGRKIQAWSIIKRIPYESFALQSHD